MPSRAPGSTRRCARLWSPTHLLRCRFLRRQPLLPRLARLQDALLLLGIHRPRSRRQDGPAPPLNQLLGHAPVGGRLVCEAARGNMK